jgi:hypothetical protein
VIWDPGRDRAAEASAIADLVRAQVAALCGGQGGDFLDDLARAVAAFVAGGGARGTPDESSVAVLASRALASVGEGAAARKLLLFGTGLARPAEWDVTGGGAMWVLDLRRAAIRSDSALELALFPALAAAVESLAEVWDGTRGRGVLGLRHVCGSAGRLLGPDAKSARVAALAGDILKLCAAKLEQAKRRRGWRETPLVMNLDA